MARASERAASDADASEEDAAPRDVDEAPRRADVGDGDGDGVASDDAKSVDGGKERPTRVSETSCEDSRERTVFIGGTSHETDEEAVRARFEGEFGAVESVKLIYDRQTMARKGYGFVKFVDVEVARRVKALEKLVIDGKSVDVKEATRDEPTGGGRTGGRGARLSSGGSRDSLSDLAARMSIGDGARPARKSGASATQEIRTGARVGAKGAALARSPNYVGAIGDETECDSESGGSVSASSAAPGTEHTVFCGGLPIEATAEALGWFFSHYGVVLSVKLIYDRRTGASKGYGFIVFADVAVAEMVKAQGQVPFMGKMVDVSEAMRHVGRPDDLRANGPGGYGSRRFGSQGPFYPPYAMYPHMGMPMPHVMGAMHPMMHQVPYPGYPIMYGGVAPYVPVTTTSTAEEANASEETAAVAPAAVAASTRDE